MKTSFESQFAAPTVHGILAFELPDPAMQQLQACRSADAS